MTLATRLVPPYRVRDLQVTLARLRAARMVNPRHPAEPDRVHYGCDICTATRRLNWLLDQLPR